MYGKVFSQLYDSTLAVKGPWQAMALWPHLIALADRHGEVDMPAEIISRKTTLPLEIVKTAIEALSAPDPDSRSPDCEGRRIVLINPGRDWGWRLVNHGTYSKIRSEEERREYFRMHKRKVRAEAKGVTDLSTPVHNVTHVDVDVDVKDQKHVRPPAAPVANFERFWINWPASPRKVGKAACSKKWAVLKPDEELLERIVHHVQLMRQTKQWSDGFEPAPLTYLNQLRWEDGVPEDAAQGKSLASQFQGAL